MDLATAEHRGFMRQGVSVRYLLAVGGRLKRRREQLIDHIGKHRIARFRVGLRRDNRIAMKYKDRWDDPPEPSVHWTMGTDDLRIGRSIGHRILVEYPLSRSHNPHAAKLPIFPK